MNRKRLKRKILMLIAGPRDQDPLNSHHEYREIKEGLLRAKQRHKFDIIPRAETLPEDLRRALLDENPDIVHFCAHGTSKGYILVENGMGEPHGVSPQIMANLFELFKDKVECVVINVCNTVEMAEALSRHIAYSVGMMGSPDTGASIRFSIGFYDAMGAGKSIEEAFKHGCQEIQFGTTFAVDGSPISNDYFPVLKTKRGYAGSAKETEFSRLGKMDRQEIGNVMKYYREVLAVDSDEPEANYHLGLCFLQLELYDLAIKHFRRSFELDPENAESYYYLALSMIRGRRPKQLVIREVRDIEQYLQTAIQLDSSHAKFYYLSAMIKYDYYATNGLSQPPPDYNQTLHQGGQNHHDRWEIERLLNSVTLRNPDLIEVIRHTPI